MVTIRDAIIAIFVLYNSLPAKYTTTIVRIPKIAGIIRATVSTTPKLINNVEIINCKSRG
jgi:hypothetical protein